MSLVFPNEMAANSTNTALARGAFWFGLVFLAAAFVTIALIVDQRSAPGVAALLAPLVVIAIAGTVAVTPLATRSLVIVAVALLTLAGNTFYTATLLPRLDVTAPSDMVLLTLPKIAIVMTGVVIGRFRSGVASIVVAYVVAEAPVVLLYLLRGDAPSVDVALTGFTAVLLLVRVMLIVTRKRSRASQPAMSRAGDAERAATLTLRRERDCSARVQDTVLDELAAVGASTPGPLSASARERILRSLELVAVPTAGTPGRPSDGESQKPEPRGDVAEALSGARELGLRVSVNGDVAPVDLLDTDVARALGFAVAHCLGNVHRHAGTRDVEVSVLTTESEVCVMVIDSGVGFTESEVGADRGGLNTAVRETLHAVGGRVQVWAAPGAGTSISMMVPRG